MVLYYIFSTLVGFLLLSLLFYPVTVRVRYFLFKKKPTESNRPLPPFSVIMAIYNEEKYLKERITFFLTQPEWNSQCEILILSGGSTDQTNAILSEYQQHSGFQIYFNQERIGKINAINYLVPRAKNEILLFSDCRQRIQDGSVKYLLEAIADNTVGIAGAKLCDTLTGKRASRLRQELNHLNILEGKLDTAFNLYGALYVAKKSIFKPVPAHLLFDEPWVVLQTLIAGKRVVMCEDAIIEDITIHDYYSQERMQRLARGLILFLLREWRLFFLLKPIHAFRYLRFKYFKLFFSFLWPIWSLITIGIFYQELSIHYPIIISLLIAASFLLARKQLRFLIQLNYSFIISVIHYITGKNRKVFWEKLRS